MTGPYGEDAGYDRDRDIATGIKPFTVVHQIEGLQAERRKGRIPAANPDHAELTRGCAHEIGSIGSCQSGKKTDDKRARDVHDDRAPRKGFADRPCDYAR